MEFPDNTRTPYIARAIVSILFVPMVSLAAAGCATQQETPIQRVLRIEPMLSGAGFHVLSAHTPARKAQLQSLTPLEMDVQGQPGALRAGPRATGDCE